MFRLSRSRFNSSFDFLLGRVLSFIDERSILPKTLGPSVVGLDFKENTSSFEESIISVSLEMFFSSFISGSTFFASSFLGILFLSRSIFPTGFSLGNFFVSISTLITSGSCVAGFSSFCSPKPSIATVGATSFDFFCSRSFSDSILIFLSLANSSTSKSNCSSEIFPLRSDFTSV